MPAGAATGLNQDNRTRLQAKQELASWIGKSDDPVGQQMAERAWDSAVRTFNGNPWKFNRISISFVLQAWDAAPSGVFLGDSDYSLSSDFRNPLRGILSDSSGRPQSWLPFKPFVALRADFPLAANSGSVGTPTLYTVQSPERDSKVSLFPMPSSGNGAGRTFFMEYHCRIARVTDDAHSLTVPQEVDEAIFWCAVKRLLAQKGAETSKWQEARENYAKSWKDVLFEYRDYVDSDPLQKRQPA